MEKITKSSKSILIDPNEPLILPDGTALVGRIEWFLYALCCLDYQNLPTPMSRIEEFANALITGEIPNIEPQSRAEQFFLAILDGNISNLPQPQSRSEVLLDKLARGEFDLSDVEPIQSHYELLLAYLIKNGGIGNIDYVLYEFSEAMKTMYNTVEKPFKSLELSGNTLVNCVLEDTENDDYTSFDKDYSGTSFTINGTSEGAIKSAILSGQTLVNLASKKTTTLAPSSNDIISNDLIKSKTTYTIAINVYTLNESSKIRIRNVLHDGSYSSSILDVNIILGKNIFTVTTVDNAKNLMLNYHNSFGTSEVVIDDIVIIEDNHANIDIPYFIGMQSVKMPVLSATGKNLWDMNKIIKSDFELNKYQPSYYGKEFELKPNTTYTINPYLREEITNTSVWTVFNVINNGNLLEVLNINRTGSNTNNKLSKITFQTGSTGKIGISIYSNRNAEVSWLGNLPFNIQLEEGPVATSYEPFKSNILTVNEDIELRGIGDIKDELNLLTGEVAERCLKRTFNGTEDWQLGANVLENTIMFTLNYIGDLIHDDYGTADALCDLLPIKSPHGNSLGIYSNDIEGVGLTTRNNLNQIRVRINKSKLMSNDVNGFKTYLNTNNLTVVCSQKESIKTVDLNVVDQNNTKIDKMHVFNEVTHVNASSDGLTPTVNIGKSVSYPTIIKPNTKYTVNLKRNDKPLTVNLGGTEVTFASGETRKTITTPSTLANDKLSYYGIGAKCNEIMLIEGEAEGNVDYFTGMQSVVMQNQMPILHTVGKNLIDNTSWESGRFDNSTGEVLGNSEFTRYAKYIQVKPSTTYVWKDDTVDFKAIYEYGATKDYIGLYGDTAYASTSVKFTTSATTKFIRIWIKNTTISSTNQLEESVSATTYEPYKTSILSCNEDVTLCGIGNVKDELDCKTGEVTQRVGKLVLDGSSDEDWRISFGGSDTHTRFIMRRGSNLKPINNVNNQRFLCDKFKCVILISGENSDEVCLMESLDNFFVSIIIDNTRLNSVDVDGFKLWLQSNPIVVQYQLATPTIKTVDLFVVDQDGNTIPKVKSHNGTTHLEVTVPKQSLLPNISAEVATDNSKDMSSLTTKHQEISEAQSAIQNSIQSQSNEIDTAMMATTEIFESILE